MSFEQLDLYPDFNLDKITEDIIKSFNGYAHNEGLNRFYEHINFILKLSKINLTYDGLINKIKLSLLKKIEADTSINFINYIKVNEKNIMGYKGLFDYKNELSNFRYVKYTSYQIYPVHFIKDNELGKYLESYKHDDIVELFDLFEDKPVKFKVIKVLYEQIEES